MGQKIQHKSFTSDLCPCKNLARRIHHILTNVGSTESYICKYRVTSKDTFATVTPKDLITNIQFSVSDLKLHHVSINPDLFGVHYLISRGGHVSESAWVKQHHHYENGIVVQPNGSHVHS